MAVDTINTANTVRSPLSVTLSVWKALFLREAVTRMMHRRYAWMWLLLEPALHVALLMFVHTLMRPHPTQGMERPVWIMVGVQVWLAFMHTAVQTRHAVNANRALISYRQVKPLDTALVRGALEGFLSIIVLVFCCLCAGLVGFQFFPDDPLALLAAFFSVWLAGLGYGLITSVAVELMPEFNDVLNMLVLPLWLMSSVIIPFSDVARPYRDWAMLLPVGHCTEAARMAFSQHYHSVPGITLAYPCGFGLVTIFLGLLLHRHFAVRMAAR